MPSNALTSVSRDLAISSWLDFFRSLAAFAVLFSHARALFLSSEGSEASFISKGLYLLSGYGHLSVMVFFVLSGYLVGGTVIRAVREKRWSWRRYFLQRGTRLYIVLIPSLILTLCWDYGEQIQSANLIPNNDTAVANIQSVTIRENTSTVIFIGNLAFLQTVVVPPLGSNTPLWSLTNEFWYYIIFPILWIAVTQSGVKCWIRVAFLMCAIAILALLGKTITLYFVIWLLGAGVAILPEVALLRKRTVRNLVIVFVTAGLTALFLLIRLGRGGDEYVADIMVASVFALLIYCMKHNRLPSSHPQLRSINALCASFSYTLYLVHLPPLIFLRACFTYEVAWQPRLDSWLKLFAIMLSVVLYAYIISLVTERQTDRLRRRLERKTLNLKG